MGDGVIFSFEDIIIGGIYLVLILILAFVIRTFNNDNPEYRWFMPNVFFKLGMGLFFAFTFKFILPYGGDTEAYWQGAVNLNNLFFESLKTFLNELMTTPSISTYRINFNYDTGYPPTWIYVAPGSFVISKIAGVLSIITFNSYLATTLIFSFFISLASFRFYQLISRFKICNEKILLLATMFIPTVAFWTSGLGKDTIILASFYFLLYHLFAVFDEQRRFTFRNLIIVLFYAWLLYSIRPFMLAAIGPPILLGFVLGYANNIRSVFLRGVSRFFIIGTSVFVIGGFFSGLNLPLVSADKYLEEAAVKQKDFTINETYGGPRYDIGITEYTPQGMLSVAPNSVIAALYRPYLWEAQGPLLLMSGIESLVLLFLTYRFFFRNGNIRKHLSFVFNQEILVFSIVFFIFFGFFVGFTAGLYNVLVRFKAPLLPFFILFLAASRNPKMIKSKKLKQ